MFLKKKDSFQELKLLKEYKIKNKHNDLLKKFSLDDAINVFYSIVFYKLNIKLNQNQIYAAKEIFKGAIIEMATGEGKTLTTMLAAYLNLLNNKNTIIVTANNYLVKRDSIQFNHLMSDLEIYSSYILGAEKQIIKKKLYKNRVTYITINNLAFDVLRDEYRKDLMIDKYENIILDEADLTLIDYANSPINIVSSDDVFPVNLFLVDRMYKDFDKDDYILNEKTKSITFTEKGYSKIENISLKNGWVKNRNDFYSSKFSNILEQFKNMITANVALKINEDYSIKGNKINIINKATGRVENNSSFGSGLQQAVEVLNKIEPSKPSVVKTMITIRTILKRFEKLSGLTGTIYDDKKEIEKSYRVKVIKVESNKTSKRYDAPDLFFTEKKYKINYLIKKVKELNEKEIPILIGTLSIEDTLEIKDKLNNEGLNVNVLTHENEDKEAEIISSAGERSSITISTKIAGRGTDIVLGGDQKKYNTYEDWKKEHDYINDLGGLFVIGFERSRQRRIDNQLKGRSGRQGDNGISVFLISLEDDILSNFNNNGSRRIFEMLNIVDRPVESKMNSKMVKVNQKNIENSYYDGRIEVSKFDEENDEYRELIRDIKTNLRKYGSLNYFKKIFDEYLISKIEYAKINYIDLEIKVGDFDAFTIDFESIQKLDSEKLLENIKNNKLDFSFINSIYFNDYFFDFYFEKINELWESMIREIPAIKKQAKMLKMLQRIEISEYSEMLEGKFKNLYFEANFKAINYCFNKHSINTYIENKKSKKELNDNLNNGISFGYLDILEVGV